MISIRFSSFEVSKATTNNVSEVVGCVGGAIHGYRSKFKAHSWNLSRCYVILHLEGKSLAMNVLPREVMAKCRDKTVDSVSFVGTGPPDSEFSRRWARRSGKLAFLIIDESDIVEEKE